MTEEYSLPINDQELEFLFKLLLNNSDYQEKARNTLFQKVEKIYLNKHNEFEFYQ